MESGICIYKAQKIAIFKKWKTRPRLNFSLPLQQKKMDSKPEISAYIDLYTDAGSPERQWHSGFVMATLLLFFLVVACIISIVLYATRSKAITKTLLRAFIPAG